MQTAATIIREYVSAFPDPLVIRKGECARVSHCDLQWRGWVWITLSSGKAGWAPQQLFSPLGTHEATCLEDYNAHELTVYVDEKITVLQSLNGWFRAQKTSGETGWVPQECVAI